MDSECHRLKWVLFFPIIKRNVKDWERHFEENGNHHFIISPYIIDYNIELKINLADFVLKSYQVNMKSIP